MKLLRLLAATPFLLAATFAYADGSASDASATSPVTASNVATTTPAPALVASTDKDLKICRMVRTIGSNRATRVCRTKAQLEAESETTRNSMNGPAGDKHF